MSPKSPFLRYVVFLWYPYNSLCECVISILFLNWQEFCCKDLMFLKQIKDMQEPIEVITFDKVKGILKYGEYCISCKYSQIFHSKKEIVTITIKDYPYSNQQYTLSDLKDIESKITLIRDSKSSTKNGHGTEDKPPENTQKARHDVSNSSDASLSKTLSPKEIDEFLDVRI